MVNDISDTQATREYAKVPNVAGLYRHTTSGRYYGCKKVRGKRREVSLRTTDRRIAERRLRDWTNNLHRVDGEKERSTFAQLIEVFISSNRGKSASTQTKHRSIVKVSKRSILPPFPTVRSLRTSLSDRKTPPRVNA